MRNDLYVIECRKPDGTLDLNGQQPEAVFGSGAYHGLTSNQIAKQLFARDPEALLDGRYVTEWPRLLDPRWVARRKTW